METIDIRLREPGFQNISGAVMVSLESKVCSGISLQRLLFRCLEGEGKKFRKEEEPLRSDAGFFDINSSYDNSLPIITGNQFRRHVHVLLTSVL
jgi:hypothetical protein